MKGNLLSHSLNRKVLAVTRKRGLAKEFIRLVNLEGGTVISLPTIDVQPAEPKVVEEFIDKISRRKYDYCIFLSSQAVNVLFDFAFKINKTKQVVSSLNSTTIVAIGPKTMQSLAKYNVAVKLIPEKYSSEGLVTLFSKMHCEGKNIIIPRSTAADEFIAKSLSALGMIVDELFLYTVQTSGVTTIWNDFSFLLQQKKIDAIIFTSRSTVLSFFEIMEKLSVNVVSLKNVKAVIAIGPRTASALSIKGIISFEAKEHTLIGTFNLAKRLLNGD